jgi:hypothetical protein
MSGSQSAPDLRAVEDRYEILGELRGGYATRYYLARRRADGADVMITVAVAPHGGENNALAHFASDAQILSRLGHPTIARVLEGKWLGSDAFAVVVERLRGPTLHELLSANERLPNTRIATALQDVDAALDWARDHGVVHRGVSPESLYFDRETSRPRIALSLTPIPLEGVPDSRADARTIGMLAWSMLAGRAYSSDAPALADLRPDLAKRVVDETNMMVSESADSEPPDVERFLSIVAMGDPLREAEVDLAQMRAQLIEERRVERIRLEAEARAYADRAAALEERLAKDRIALEQRIVREEKRIASEQQDLAVERAQLEQERIALSARIAELERERDEVERLRAVATAAPATAVPSPAEAPAPRTSAAISANDDAGDGGNHSGWMVPVATIALLIILMVFGAMIARRRPNMPHAITVGTTRVLPTIPPAQPATVPRGGFLTQSPGSIGSQLAGRIARDSARARLDSIASRDSAANRDTSARRAATRPDTTRR